MLRLDLIDPLISGNKWFKLVEHLNAASDAGADGVITLGGAWSNHLHAVAAAGKRFGFATVGLLRGHPQDTATVTDLQAFGMHLHWLGYGGYRARHAPGFWPSWREQYPHLYPVPEGGGGLLGARGCGQLLALAAGQLSALGWCDHDGWWLACGTGTTLAGMVLAEGGRHPLYGVLAVPEDHGVMQQVERILAEGGQPNAGFELIDGSRAGFAKVDPALQAFIDSTEHACGLPLEPVYTAKALLMLKQQVEAGRFAKGSRLIFVHTGGLQGRRGFPAISQG